jgi:predicted secreted protein
MKKYSIGIYEDTKAETLANIVETITEASKWIGCTIDALYKAQHLTGVMKAKGYKIELIENKEDIDNA